VHYGVAGATVAGVAFVLPSFFMVIALGAAYVAYGGLTWMQAVFYGVGAAVIGIVALSAYKLTAKSVGKDWLLWAIYLVAAAITVVTESEILWVFLAAGLIVWLVRAPPRNSWQKGGNASLIGFAAAAENLPVAAGAASTLDWPVLVQIGIFFAEAGAFVFGSGLAIVPFLYGGVVTAASLADRAPVRGCCSRRHDHAWTSRDYGWIHRLSGVRFGGCNGRRPGDFPAVLSLHDHPGAVLAQARQETGIVAFVDGCTAAAIGTIAGAVIVLGKRSIVDMPTALIMAVALLLLWKVRKIPEPAIVGLAALAGLMAYPLR